MGLTHFWMKLAQDRAARSVDGFADMTIVDSWKVDGYNDGTATLVLVCEKLDGSFVRIDMPDYSPPEVRPVVRKVVTHEVWAL
jgi:hypothetical protein